MNIYLISQNERDDYDTYDSAIVAAKTEDEARLINPSGNGWEDPPSPWRCWCSTPDLVTVKHIGVALSDIETGIILSSFNAG